MKIHTSLTSELLREIEEKTNIVWASGSRPTKSSFALEFDLLFLNHNSQNELTFDNIAGEYETSTLVTPEEFLSECIRIAPKTGGE